MLGIYRPGVVIVFGDVDPATAAIPERVPTVLCVIDYSSKETLTRNR